jgi:hypothetical protein
MFTAGKMPLAQYSDFQSEPEHANGTQRTTVAVA